MGSSELVVMPKNAKELTIASIPVHLPSLISEPFRPVVSDKVVDQVYETSFKGILGFHRFVSNTLVMGVSSLSGAAGCGAALFGIMEGMADVGLTGGAIFGVNVAIAATGVFQKFWLDAKALSSSKRPLYGQLVRKNRAAFVEWVKGRYGIELSPEVPEDGNYKDLTRADGTAAPYRVEKVYDLDGNPAGIVLSHIRKGILVDDIPEVPVHIKPLESGKRVEGELVLEGEAQLLLKALNQKQKKVAGLPLNEDEAHCFERVNQELTTLLNSMRLLSDMGESTDVPECVDVLSSMNAQLQGIILNKVKDVRSGLAVQSAVLKAGIVTNSLKLEPSSKMNG